jgi:hypothetical protein
MNKIQIRADWSYDGTEPKEDKSYTVTYSAEEESVQNDLLVYAIQDLVRTIRPPRMLATLAGVIDDMASMGDFPDQGPNEKIADKELALILAARAVVDEWDKI